MDEFEKELLNKLLNYVIKVDFTTFQEGYLKSKNGLSDLVPYEFLIKIKELLELEADCHPYLLWKRLLYFINIEGKFYYYDDVFGKHIELPKFTEILKS